MHYSLAQLCHYACRPLLPCNRDLKTYRVHNYVYICMHEVQHAIRPVQKAIL